MTADLSKLNTNNQIYRFRPSLKVDLPGLTQEKRKVLFDFCNSAMRYNIYCLAFCIELNTQNSNSEKHFVHAELLGLIVIKARLS